MRWRSGSHSLHQRLVSNPNSQPGGPAKAGPPFWVKTMLILSSICRKRIEPSQSLTLWNGSNRRHIITMPTTTRQIPQLTPQQQVNFWKKVDQNGPTMPHMDTPCWTWTGAKSKQGYGYFGIGRSIFKAHRIAFVLDGRTLCDPKPQALHYCDNPSCCNPSHMFCGTNSDNVADRMKKGRSNAPRGESHMSRTHPECVARGERSGRYTMPERTARGEAHGRSKLSAKDVIEIREAQSIRGMKFALAKRFGISHTTITKIIQRKTWAHVT
jgi:hypothetical protein